MEQESKTRDWRYGVAVLGGGLLISLAAAYHFDLLEREPYPVLRSELQIDDVDTNLLLPRFQWLDDHRLVVVAFDHFKPMPTGRSHQMDALVVWDIATNTTTKVVEPDVGGLCVLDGQVLYFKRLIDPTGAIYRDSQRRIHYRGPIGKGEPIPFKEPTDPRTCAPKSDHSGLPEWANAERDADANIRRLKPEDGFLVIRRTSRDAPAEGIVLHRPDGSSSDVSSILGERSVKYPYVQPIYFAFKNAYLMHLSGSWLHRDGRVIPDSALSPKPLVIDRSLRGDHLTPTAKSPVFVARTFEPGYIGKQGLYELIVTDRHRRVITGRIGREREVSPDGCKVAYANDDRWRIDRNAPRDVFKLQVITLCSEKQP